MSIDVRRWATLRVLGIGDSPLCKIVACPDSEFAMGKICRMMTMIIMHMDVI